MSYRGFLWISFGILGFCGTCGGSVWVGFLLSVIGSWLFDPGGYGSVFRVPYTTDVGITSERLYISQKVSNIFECGRIAEVFSLNVGEF